MTAQIGHLLRVLNTNLAFAREHVVVESFLSLAVWYGAVGSIGDGDFFALLNGSGKQIQTKRILPFYAPLVVSLTYLQ